MALEIVQNLDFKSSAPRLRGVRSPRTSTLLGERCQHQTQNSSRKKYWINFRPPGHYRCEAWGITQKLVLHLFVLGEMNVELFIYRWKCLKAYLTPNMDTIGWYSLGTKLKGWLWMRGWQNHHHTEQRRTPNWDSQFLTSTPYSLIASNPKQLIISQMKVRRSPLDGHSGRTRSKIGRLLENVY